MNQSVTDSSLPLDAPQPTIPLPRGPVPQAPPERERRSIEIKIDDKPVSVAEGSTILDAAKKLGVDTPTPVSYTHLDVYKRQGRHSVAVL